MKILFVITGLGVGGAERQVVDIADRLVALGHVIKIAYLTGPALVRPHSLEIDIIGFQMQKTASGFIRAYFGLKKLIQSFGPDVVHSHMIHANILTRVVRLTCRIPRLVCTAHSTNEGGKLRMLGYRLTAPLADVSTNVSIEAVAAFEAQGAVAPGSMLAVPNGIDTERFQPSDSARVEFRRREGISEDEKVIIAVGRLNQAKDYPNLFRAFADVLRSIGKVSLWIVGDGELRANLVEEVARNGITEKVKFLGVQSNVADWINAADVFTLSSAWEGFGLVVAEAMACKKVVVATDAGGVKEVLGNCGYLVPIRNSNALSAALKEALRLPTEAAGSLGQAARERIISCYSLDNTVKRWCSIYEEARSSVTK